MNKAKKSKRLKKDLKIEKNLEERFNETFPNHTKRFGNEVIEQVNVADANLQYTKIFGANKNLYRSIASLQDGMKPGKRRLFYSWWELDKCVTSTSRENLKKLRFIKVSNLSSTTTAEYHPHGSTPIDDNIGNEGQYWNNNIMTIVPQGSYGNLRGDLYAAGRYREAKLSEYTIDCFFDDFDKYCVPMKRNYADTGEEPEFLPAKYPHILFNPQFSGIGVGMASNIPPFNVAEVLDATITLMRNPDAKICLIPDSPTGCDIVDIGTFKEINKTGQSKIKMRATTEIDYVRNMIAVTSLPLNVTSQSVILKIIELKNKKEFDKNPIIEIKDYTKEGEVRIEIFLAQGAKPEKVLKKLFKKSTGLKMTYPVGITVIDDYSMYEYGIKELLLQWIDYRIDIVRSMLLNYWQISLTDQHMNEVLLMVFGKNNIDKTVKIAKSSKSRKETIDKLMEEFKITSLQAATIADMHIYNFNEDSYNNYVEKGKKIKEKLEEIEANLKDEKTLKEFIINQLEDGKKKWGRKRQSAIIKEDDEDNEIEIEDIDYLLGVSESGFIKKIPSDSSSIGYVGKTNGNMFVFDINNKESILVVDSKGNVIKVAISNIPEMDFDDVGVELSRFCSIKGDVKAVMELPSMDILKVKDEAFGIIFVTKHGLAKRVQLSEFKKIVDSKQGIILNDDDELAAAIFSTENSNKDLIISTDKGNGIRLPLNEIRNNGVMAKGTSMISLRDEEIVIDASLINTKNKFLFYVTSSGRVKITEMKYFPKMNRIDDSISLITLQGNETLIGISTVNTNDHVIIYKKKNEPEVINIKDLKVSTRASKGDKLIKTGFGDTVVAYKVVHK